MTEPIAIIGTACRLPGSASSPSKLWELLKSPKDVIGPVAAERLNLSNFYSSNGENHGRTDVKQQPYLLDEDVRLFDAAFFRINPKEAEGLDPQHRILLETVYEAFEAAGLTLSAIEGSKTSVHVGVMTDDYYTIQARDPDTMGSHAATGLSRCILSNRVSYAFDLRGPSMTVDTACSSSLVALHLAVQSLRKGEASTAVVGGTSLLLDPHWFVAESSLHMLSPDSRSRMWDAQANGYARGEGCAAVILKPLSKAIQDGDHIECIIRETGVNSDGRTSGLTMPCPMAQAALIRQTYQNAGLDPVEDRCQYFECHGTGTQAGDPVEARAISDAFFPPGTYNQGERAAHQQGLESQYWVDNMVQPVLFSDAVQFAVQNLGAPLAVALEVGPHPALKGPVSQILKSLSALPMPYIGCLERDRGGIESMSMAVGMVWNHLGPSAVDFSGWRDAFNLPRQRTPLKDLPTYAWDHDQVYWRESRLSHNMRVGGQPPHNLLGRQREDSQYEKTWRNIFYLDEMPWVKGHTFQGQVLFPGAGYVSLALEASKAFVHGRSIKLFEVRDMRIPKALVIGEDKGVEVLFTVRSKTLHTTVADGSILEAEFVAYSCSDERILDKTCDGQLLIHLGPTGPGNLPSNPISQAELASLGTDRFYRAVSEIELDYDGVFRTLHSISRSWGHAKASASWSRGDLDIGCSLHPALLDVAFQVGLGTFLSTAEKSMGSPYLPIGIKRAIIDPNQSYKDDAGSTNIDIEAMMATANASVVEVDISVCAKAENETQSCGIQIDGLILKAIAEPQPSEDRNLFVKTTWDVDCAYGMTALPPVTSDTVDPLATIDACERVTLFYMQNLIRELSSKELESAPWHHQELIRFILTTLSIVREGKHAIICKEWLDDDRDTITKLVDSHPDNVDIEMLVAVGENLPSVVRKESGMMEHMLNNDLLSRLYKESSGLAACNRHIADLMRRISHKHPRTKILEIGAGTGGTTVSVLNAVGEAYTSYTCTDISASFFNGVSEKLSENHTSKVNFKVFNVEKPPAAQDFAEGSYDVVIAANVLHATRKLSETIQNARALLRPGGYLIAIEVTGTMIRETGLMGGLEGWWLGAEEGRSMGPGIGPREWDSILEQNGFSGIDCIAHDYPDFTRHSCSVFATQAVDDRLEVLRDPLSSMALVPQCPVLILGGKTLAVSKLARRTSKMLSLWSTEIRTCDSIDDLDSSIIAPGTFVLCLSDLDKPFFSEPPTPERLDRLQAMLGAARNILWVTCGRMLDDPYANMMVGIGRALAVELPHVNMHYLDFDSSEAWNADVLVRQVLRMAVTLVSSAGTQGMLWSQEPETLVKGNKMLVPRVKPDHAANEKLNAKRRTISKLVNLTERITIAPNGVFSPSQQQLVTGGDLSIPEGHVAVDVNIDRLSPVLNWERHEPVSAVIQPLEASSIFSVDKTYFLVGMAGELGQSLCRFMIRGGARNIVLASRNPAEDPHWLMDLRSTGANVRIVKMDVTDRKQVRTTVAMLRRTMPEIGGVANGALVFEAGIFVNFSADNVARQLKPKVDGTLHLDEAFATDNLEFFLTFGSLATVCGNPGQAMYHAGNMFMSSLVERRRRRGQAASILNFGLLVDVGYVARMDRADGTNIEGTLRSLLLTPLSEAELHHLVLQGIISGRPDSDSGEVIMGMAPYIDDGKAAARPPWVDKAFFSHMIHAPVSVTTSQVSPQTSPSLTLHHLRESLNRAGTMTEVTEGVRELIYKKIELMIKVPSTSIDDNSPLADLGLDSLHGIDIRKWLLEELKINIPLLKILGREPISSLCSSVAQKFMEGRGESGDQLKMPVPAAKNPIPEAPEPQRDNNSGFKKSPLDFPLNEARDSEGEVPSASPGTPTSSDDDTLSTDSGSVDEYGETDPIAPLSLPPSSLPPHLGSDSPALLKPEVIEYKRSDRLSFAQAGIHFLHTFLEDPTSFNVTTRYAVRGRLNVSRITHAIEKTLGHHEAYQTCFFAGSGSFQVKQHVASDLNLRRFRHVSSTREEANRDAQDAFEEVANAKYQLASGETFRAILVTHEPERHTLIAGFHLMASDALSFSIFLRDLDRAYQMLPLSAKTGSYLDFTHQQHEDVDARRFDESIAYWKRQLDPVPTPLPLLPVAHASSRKARRAYQNHTVERELGSDVARQIKEASKASGATPMQFYLAAMQVLLARLADVDDVCIGVADSGRSHTGDFADSVGHFANILPIRFKIDSAQSFEDLVNRTSHSVLNAFDNSQVPFDLLLERLGIERSPTHTPLFQVAFNYRVGDILERPLGDCVLSMEQYVDIKTPYDLVINATQTGSQGHLVECITSSNLYSLAATEFITETFIGLVESLARDQSVRVRDCKLFSNEQVTGALALGRGPTIKHPWPKTLSERFQHVVSAFPSSIAIKDAGESLTYSLLARRVGLYASSLLHASAGPGSRVAVLCEPGIDIYVTMLAALHIGAVYVPLDFKLPDARIRSMIDACRPDVIVFHATTATAAMECSGDDRIRAVDLSRLEALSSDSDSLPPLASTSGSRESFLLFTSGSTGTPKGIRLGQGGIMNYTASKSAMLGLGQVRVLQQTSVGFDMAIAQAFNAFANGGTLVIAPSKARGDPSMISQIILDEGIEFTLATPSEYLMLATYATDTLQKCKSWRFACSGGEVVSERLLNSLRRLELPKLSFTDCYGPTEVSCATTFRSIPLSAGTDEVVESNGPRDGATSAVGKAIPNTAIYILSEDGKTAFPAGMPGEICIGGSGVARGYLDAGLSRDKFVPNPFATRDDRARGQDVMYHTGDKGYLRMDGSLAFLGRINGGETVVKLRGLRIDLNEVANAILAAARKDSLADAIVMVRGETQFLVAYVVLARGKSLDHEQLDMLLQDLELPRYMIPSMIVPLDRLPTSTNGKVDRAALNALPLPDRHAKGDAKGTLTVPEGELRVLWQTVLGEAAGAAPLGPNSDFFTVGGSSLLLVRLQNLLKERTGVALSLQDLYQATTLRKMAAAMHQERGQLTEEIIDWDAETAIPERIAQATIDEPSSPPPKSHHRQVLLTGAGTFLGVEILGQLTKNDDVAKIHCIAVSDDERQKLASEDNGSGKVVVYAGSMMSPTLGLSGTEREFLRSNIDQIIHAAVQGHCMNNYTSVKQALYVSTQTLVGLALPRRVPFHFVSAPRVVLLSGEHEGKPVSMAPHYPPTDGSQGVTASKWASEFFLERVAQAAGLPVVVHRHCALIGERAPADDVMNSVVRFSLLTRKVPKVAGAEGFFDFKDVVAVASEMVGETPATTGPVRYCHHSGGVRVPFTELAQRLSDVYGGEFEVVEPSEWLQAAAEFGMGELLVIHLKANMESGKPMVFPYLGA
ncbi:hypothetical protein ACHAQA_003055 [Verticillium albo-atrum]